MDRKSQKPLLFGNRFEGNCWFLSKVWCFFDQSFHRPCRRRILHGCCAFCLCIIQFENALRWLAKMWLWGFENCGLRFKNKNSHGNLLEMRWKFVQLPESSKYWMWSNFSTPKKRFITGQSPANIKYAENSSRCSRSHQQLWVNLTESYPSRRAPKPFPIAKTYWVVFVSKRSNAVNTPFNRGQ